MFFVIILQGGIYMNVKTLLKNVSIDVIGGLLIGFGVYNFAAHCGFPMAGISGIALIIYHLFHLPIGFVTLALNVPIVLLCYKVLGKKFLLRSLQTMLISSFMIDFVCPLFPVFEGDLMLSAICTGFLCGVGYAMIYANDTSTGGSDFIIMMVRAFRPHMSLGTITLLIDTVIVALGGLLFNNIEGMIYGFVLTYIISKVVDEVTLGVDRGKMTLIVTDNGPLVCSRIHDLTDRGSTIIKAEGSFSKEDKQVVMCACSNKQLHLVQKAVKEVDENAFMVIVDSSEVRGEGFKPH